MASPSLVTFAPSPSTAPHDRSSYPTTPHDRSSSNVERRMHMVRALSGELLRPGSGGAGVCTPPLSSGRRSAEMRPPLFPIRTSDSPQAPLSAGGRRSSNGDWRMPLFPLPPTLDSPLASSNGDASDDDLPLSAARLSLKRVRSFHTGVRTPSMLGRQGSTHSLHSPFARATPFARPSPVGRGGGWGGTASATPEVPEPTPMVPPAPSPVATTSSAKGGGFSAFPPPLLDISDEACASSSSAPSAGASIHEAATRAAAFRPPPIHTMASLEGWGVLEREPADGRGSSMSMLSGSSSAVHLVGLGELGGSSSSLAAPVANATAPASASTPSMRPPPALSASAAAAPNPAGPPPPVRPPSPMDDGLLAPPPTPSARGGSRRRGFGGGGSSRREPPPPMSLVAPSLYVGDENAAANLEGLRAAGVTHVLNCTNHVAYQHAGAPDAPVYMQLGLVDNTSDLPRMQEALALAVGFIRDALSGGGVCLVHCHRGISRSATVAIAYLVQATQTPAELVFERMRPKRRVIDPNLGYWVALKEWERRVLPPAVLRGRSSSYSSPTPLAASGPRPLSRAG